MRKPSGQRGFTLVEAIVVMAVIGILAAIGVPTLQRTLPNMRLKGAARDLYSVMLRAKSEALRRGENITVLFDAPNNRYRVFIDNGAGAGGVANDEVQNGSEAVVIDWLTLPDRVTFNPNGTTDAAVPVAFVNTTFANSALVFTSRGIPASAANNPPSGLGAGTVGLRAVDANGNTQRQRNIIVSTAGRIRINAK